ncbi:MAG: hypothetical protein ACRDBM_02830 [Sporomusa sp.]
MAKLVIRDKDLVFETNITSSVVERIIELAIEDNRRTRNIMRNNRQAKANDHALPKMQAANP